MKDDLNIEELFQDKFNNFESDVDPNLWNSISSQIGTTGAAGGATGGLSALMKTVLVSGGIVAAGFTAVYINYSGEETNPSGETVNTNEILVENSESNILQDSVIHVENVNDPVILENKEEIERELNNKQYEDEVDDHLVNQVLINQGDQGHQSNTQHNEQTNAGGSEQGSTNETNVTVESGNNEGNQNEPEIKYPTGRIEFAQVGNSVPATINFKSNAINYVTVEWNFGDGSTGKGETIKYTYSRPGSYSVTMKVLGKKGTVYEETKLVEIKSSSSIDNVPNVITPNGDRINDYFSVKTTRIETFFISIRDVNGNAVFETNDKDFEWDGTSMTGDRVPNGTYVYTIIAEGEDGSVFKIPGQLYVR